MGAFADVKIFLIEHPSHFSSFQEKNIWLPCSIKTSFTDVNASIIFPSKKI